MPNWSIWASTWAWCAWRADKFLSGSHQTFVGGGLPPIAVDQSCMYWLTHCYRGQAPSHILNRGALTVPGARAVLAAFHIGILKVRIVLAAAREGGLFQVALTELGLLQISIAQIRPLQVGLAQPGHFQVGGAQVGLVHLCPGQPGELQ